MLKRDTHRWLARALVAATVSAIPAVAAAQPSLSVSTDKATYVPGEPIVAHVAVRNDVGTALQVPVMLTPEYGALTFLITRSGEPNRTFRPWTVIDNARTQSLAPGQSLTVQCRIFYGASGWTFREPGNYEIRAQLQGVVSDPASLTIRAPSGAEAEESARLMDSPQAGFFLLFDGGDHLKEGIDTLTRIAASNTGLAGYANFALGMRSATPFTDYLKGTLREPNWTEAESFLRRSRTLIPKDAYFFSINSDTQLSMVLMRNNKAAEATKLRQDLTSFLAEDVLKRPLAAALKGYVQSVKPQQ